MSTGIINEILLVELVIFLALAIVLLVLLIWWLIRKLVLVPTLTVTTDKAEYLRGETVKVSGTLKDGTTPLPGKTVSITIEPPVGDAYGLPDVTTDSNGAYSADWVVPANAVGGNYAAVASAMGVSASKAFKLE